MAKKNGYCEQPNNSQKYLHYKAIFKHPMKISNGGGGGVC